MTRLLLILLACLSVTFLGCDDDGGTDGTGGSGAAGGTGGEGGAGAAGGAGGEGGAGAAGGAGGEGGAGAAGGAGGEGGAGAAGGTGGEGGAGAAGGSGGEGGAGAAGGTGGEGGAGAAGGTGGEGGAGAAGGAGGMGGAGGEPACLPEAGFGRPDPEGNADVPCCEGLVRVPGTSPGVNGCFGEEGTYACTLCGNGECGLGENSCNCPADCMAAECIPEGGRLDINDPNAMCCPGFFPGDCMTIDENDACVMCEGVASICINSGDGVCGEGENRCNSNIDRAP